MDGYAPLSLARRFDPRNEDLFTDRTVRRFIVAARMKPDVSVKEAQAAVTTLAAQLVAEHPVEEKGTGARVIPEPLARPLPWPVLSNCCRSSLLLLVLSLVVLLIACLNVANILLVRVTVREREMAVRASLGAGRAGLMRLLLIESLVLAVLGTALGTGHRQGRKRPVRRFGHARHGRSLPAGCAFRLARLRLFRRRGHRHRPGGGRAARSSRVAHVHHAPAARRRPFGIDQPSPHARTQCPGRHAGRRLARAAHHRRTVRAQPDAGATGGSGIRFGSRGHGQVGHAQYRPDRRRSAAFYDELHRRLRAIPGVESASLSFNIPLGWIIGSYIASAEDGRRPATCRSRPLAATV